MLFAYKQNEKLTIYMYACLYACEHADNHSIDRAIINFHYNLLMRAYVSLDRVDTVS